MGPYCLGEAIIDAVINVLVGKIYFQLCEETVDFWSRSLSVLTPPVPVILVVPAISAFVSRMEVFDGGI